MSQQPTTLQFTETMKGYVQKLSLAPQSSLSQQIYWDAYHECKKRQDPLSSFTLTIKIDDLESFKNHPQFEAAASGHIVCPLIASAPLPIHKGVFRLFVPAQHSTELNTSKEMHYLLQFFSGQQAYTLFGFKDIQREDLHEAWSETTTLYVSLYRDHLLFSQLQQQHPIYAGVFRIAPDDFAQQMLSFATNAQGFSQKAEVLTQFFGVFGSELWNAYAPFLFGTDQKRWNEHLIPLQTTEGVKGAQHEQIHFSTGDGLALTLDRFMSAKSSNPVLLVHGLTTSTDMFIMPEHYNLVQYLLNHGFTEVWSLDWRGSNRHIYNLKPLPYTVDEVIHYDLPAALTTIQRVRKDATPLHVICHCVGSLAVMGALANRRLLAKSVVANSVSFTPQVRWQARLKLWAGPFVFERIFGYPYVSPEMPFFPANRFGKWIFWMERLLRRECREPACHMISFMWGWGFPAAYQHEQLHVVTHRRLKDLFGGTHVNWYRHIRQMVERGFLGVYAKTAQHYGLALNSLEQTREVSMPPLLLLSGDQNHIFPNSNAQTYQWLRQNAPQHSVEYQEIKGYGHQDVFMGKNVHRDVFPQVVQFLKQHSTVEEST